MYKKYLVKGQRGLSLIEVLIAMAFIALIYGFVVQVFFQGFRVINLGDIEDDAVRLANNTMKKASSIDNPLFIGLNEDPAGYIYIQLIKDGKMLPYELVQQGIVDLGVRSTIKEEDAQNSTDNELAKAGNSRVTFTRTMDWQVEDVEPVLVHLWVTVKYSDPEGEMKAGSYTLETLLAP